MILLKKNTDELVNNAQKSVRQLIMIQITFDSLQYNSETIELF